MICTCLVFCHNSSIVQFFNLNVSYYWYVLTEAFVFICVTASQPGSYDVIIENNEFEKAYSEFKAAITKVVTYLA
jgi:hypothetical protein